MKKVLGFVVGLGMMVSVSNAGVKEVYVGSTNSHGKQYVIKCTNGSSINGVHQKSDGSWYSVSSNMGSKYKNQSINSVASEYCR